MEYVKVQWIHSFADEPVWLYLELDDGRLETRKVEVFPDGTTGFADQHESVGSTRLAWLPTPPLAEIARDPQFVPTESTTQEFEEAWSCRRTNPRAE